MSIFDHFKRAMGIPPRDHPEGIRPGFKNPIWGEDDDDDDELDEDFRGFSANRPDFNFSVFSGDPFRIHQYFEQQMDEMLKSFTSNFGFDFSGNDNHLYLDKKPFSGNDNHLYLEEKPHEENSVRSQYLKPSFDRQLEKKSARRVDSDIDGKVDINALDLFPEGNRSNVPAMRSPSNFFGSYSSSSTITKPNGGVEQHRVVKKSDGTKEESVTRQMGDQQYTVVTITDKNGIVEKKEEFVNMDENNLADFNRKWGHGGTSGNVEFPRRSLLDWFKNLH